MTRTETQPAGAWPGDRVRLRKRKVHCVNAPDVTLPPSTTGTLCELVVWPGQHFVALDAPGPGGVCLVHVELEDVLIVTGGRI
jgi:hypothetical protein